MFSKKSTISDPSDLLSFFPILKRDAVYNMSSLTTYSLYQKKNVLKEELNYRKENSVSTLSSVYSAFMIYFIHLLNLSTRCLLASLLI